jgi:hypothetical protein
VLSIYGSTAFDLYSPAAAGATARFARSSAPAPPLARVGYHFSLTLVCSENTFNSIDDSHSQYGPCKQSDTPARLVALFSPRYFAVKTRFN